MYKFGVWLVIAGAVTFFFGVFGEKTALGGSVANLEFLRDRLALIEASGPLFIAGAVLCAGGAVVERILNVRDELRNAGILPKPETLEHAKPSGHLARLAARRSEKGQGEPPTHPYK